MSRKWYGSLNNRLEEDKQFCDEITVGTGVTEYSWSDREAYEVIEVTDQKHVKIRRLDHLATGEFGSNHWELRSNEENPSYNLTKRGKYWYFTDTITVDELDRLCLQDAMAELRLAIAGFDVKRIREKGKQTRLRRAHVSFGIADYYYDYSF